jgi:hypothetical protein
MAIEIVDLPIKKCDFPYIAMLVYQRVCSHSKLPSQLKALPVNEIGKNPCEISGPQNKGHLSLVIVHRLQGTLQELSRNYLSS